MTVRVRFAPSPTGTLHVGSARTALFNYFFAKHEGGTFILRIEDTDQKRSNPEFLNDIYQSLEFLGIKADEGPYFQSQRQALYQEHAERLLKSGQAKHQEGAVVFPVPPAQVTFVDLLRGDITVETTLFESLVLMKSDGTPTYNFACVVDDALMRITHIIRGDDHIANTPKQVVLYQAMGYPLPVFAHIPLIVGADRARLSKREGATSVAEYREVGYVADAFVNYLALLGWSPGGDREQVPPAEIVKLFDLRKVKKAAAYFDQRKLDWLNSQYLKQMPVPDLARRLGERLVAKGLLPPAYDAAWLERVAAIVRDRLKVLGDIEEQHAFFFQEPPVYDPEAVAKFLRQDSIGAHLAALKARLSRLDAFDAGTVEQAVRGFCTEQGLEAKALMHPVRVALTGRAVSPPLFDVMAVLGQARVVRRLDHAAGTLAKAG